MKVKLLLLVSLPNDDGMSRVVSSGTSSTNVSLVSEDVDKFPFALVPPLGTENNSYSRVG